MTQGSKMTSRERALAVANRKMPIVLASVFKATPEVDSELMAHFGVKNVEDLIPILGICHLHWPWKHIRPHGLDLTKRSRRPSAIIGDDLLQMKDGMLRDVWGIGRKEVSYGKGTYLEYAFNPLAGAKTVADIENYPWPRLEDLDFSHVIEDCDKYAGTALSLTEWGLHETAWMMRGFEQYFMDLASDEKMAEAILDHIEAFEWQVIEKLWGIAGDRYDFFGTGDDFGTQEALFMSVETWEKFYGKRYRRAFEFGHKHGLKTWMHCDGAVRALIPKFIDAGLDILDPLMPMIPSMNPYKVIPEFGKDLCFHGTIDVQHMLPFESEKTVRDEVKRQMETLWPRGGLFMGPSHCVQPGTPINNILAVYEELNKYK